MELGSNFIAAIYGMQAHLPALYIAQMDQKILVKVWDREYHVEAILNLEVLLLEVALSGGLQLGLESFTSIRFDSVNFRWRD